MSTKRSYHQFCGLAAALDVVGERWALLVVRELEPGPRRFTDLFEALPGISTDVLAERLRQLEGAGAVQRTELRHPVPAKLYELTPRGSELATIAASLALWGAPLLHVPPEPDLHVRPQWALQSMTHSYRGGLDDGSYQLAIADDTFTVVVEGDVARLVYGPAAHPPQLSIACTADTFFRLVGDGGHDQVELRVGSVAALRRFVNRLPLRVGPGADHDRTRA